MNGEGTETSEIRNHNLLQNLGNLDIVFIYLFLYFYSLFSVCVQVEEKGRGLCIFDTK